MNSIRREERKGIRKLKGVGGGLLCKENEKEKNGVENKRRGGKTMLKKKVQRRWGGQETKKPGCKTGEGGEDGLGHRPNYNPD